jgi:glutamine synthetase
MQKANGLEVTPLSDIYGSNVFSDSVMRQTLPKETYKALRQTIEEGTPLDPRLQK